MAEVTVVGAGQAGLALAYCLKRMGRLAEVVDAADRIGDPWRQRYESLRLFTPSQYCSLPGREFPFPPDRYPTGSEVGDYLEAYASFQGIPVRLATRIVSVRRGGAGFVLQSAAASWDSKVLAIAAGTLATPYIPEVRGGLSESVFQMHSSQYRNRLQVPPGRVLVVGAGNSGVQIAEELCTVREVTLAASRLPSMIPRRVLGKSVFWWFERLGVLGSDAVVTTTGASPGASIPLIGMSALWLLATGRLRRRPNVVGSEGGSVVFGDGSRDRFSTIIWATGFRNRYPWIDIADAFDAAGTPRHDRGVSPVPGLYWIGLPGLRTKGSGLLGYVGRDAQWLAGQISGSLERDT